jgi:hypothetical protein
VARFSRFLNAFALPADSRSEVVRNQLIEAFEVLPATLRRTLTWDPGSEMARHAEVTAALGTLIYFCDPASPWLLLLPPEGAVLLTTAGDNSRELSTAAAVRELPQWLPIAAADNPN